MPGPHRAADDVFADHRTAGSRPEVVVCTLCASCANLCEPVSNEVRPCSAPASAIGPQASCSKSFGEVRSRLSSRHFLSSKRVSLRVHVPNAQEPSSAVPEPMGSMKFGGEDRSRTTSLRTLAIDRALLVRLGSGTGSGTLPFSA